MKKEVIASIIEKEFSELHSKSQFRITQFIDNIYNIAAKNILDCDDTLHNIEEYTEHLGYDVFYINDKPTYL